MLLPAILATVIAAHPSTSADEALRMMSYNIRYGTAKDGDDRWEVRRPRTLKLLRTHRPEVLAVQEALAFQIDEIRREFPNYGVVGVGREDGKAAGEHSAILYDRDRLVPLRSDTFWLSDTPTVPNSMHWGNRITRICTWAFFRDLKTNRYFYHFNVHLDHESQPSRERSIALILNRIRERATSDPVVLTGDFNVGEENAVISAAKAADFRDTYRLKNATATDPGTFNGFRPTVGKDKIDYIFVDAKAEVIEAAHVMDKVDGRWPSDHVPVTARIILP